MCVFCFVLKGFVLTGGAGPGPNRNFWSSGHDHVHQIYNVPGLDYRNELWDNFATIPHVFVGSPGNMLTHSKSHKFTQSQHFDVKQKDFKNIKEFYLINPFVVAPMLSSYGHHGLDDGSFYEHPVTSEVISAPGQPLDVQRA